MRPELEKLGLFYLGREIEPATGALTDRPLLYDSRDLTTHGFIVGMTGSGKTGLGLALLEEAAIDGIPVIAIDPKGDVGNLLLTFPELRPEDFAPWVSADAARAAGQSAADFAAAEARKWREGLASWDQDGDRIRRLRQQADLAIYTPGSSAGRPLSVLGALSTPGSTTIAADQEAVTARASAAASSILGLAGIEADPLTSREHILLATLFQQFWRDGGDVDVTSLVAAVQSPPLARVGALELDTFFPAKDRAALSLRLNNLVASPSFAAWTEGEPLSASSLFYTAAGTPRVSVISIAHLSDAERMFVVSLLLSEIVSWVRSQPGTSSLRALLYFDEVAGYLPPVANPPSKQPMLTLLKQARASGLGVVLATQNPIDIDYKALSNAGTWFLGRLQTERDKARLLDGLDAAGGAALQGSRSALEATISGLEKRRFVLHNVHAKQAVLFESRWALSYLRGPLTREDIKKLTPPAAPSEPSGSRLQARPRGHKGPLGSLQRRQADHRYGDSAALSASSGGRDRSLSALPLWLCATLLRRQQGGGGGGAPHQRHRATRSGHPRHRLGPCISGRRGAAGLAGSRACRRSLWTVADVCHQRREVLEARARLRPVAWPHAAARAVPPCGIEDDVASGRIVTRLPHPAARCGPRKARRRRRPPPP